MNLKFTTKMVAVAVAAVTIVFSACTGESKKGSMKDLDVAEFSELIQKQDTIIILDVSGDQYGDIMITGAVAYPISSDEEAVAVIQKYGTMTPYAVYDITGAKSKKAAELLSKKGANVYNLKNGLVNWIEEDQEIVIMPLDSTMQAPVTTTKSKIMADSAMMVKLKMNQPDTTKGM